jgi:hypothetical protein
VQDYSLYIIARSGRLVREIEVDCAGDDEAIDLAQRWVDDHDAELWQLDRMVARFSTGDRQHPHASLHGSRAPASLCSRLPAIAWQQLT